MRKIFTMIRIREGSGYLIFKLTDRIPGDPAYIVENTATREQRDFSNLRKAARYAKQLETKFYPTGS